MYLSKAITNRFVMEIQKNMLSVVMWKRHHSTLEQKNRLSDVCLILKGITVAPTRKSLNANDKINKLAVLLLKTFVFRMENMTSALLVMLMMKMMMYMAR